MDLAGGTLDCWPLFLLLPRRRCQTVNLSIDINTNVELVPGKDSVVHVAISDYNYSKTFNNLDELLQCNDKALVLIKEHVAFWMPQTGFTLTTQSQSPVGGGLGGSSSLSISLLKAFSKWQERPLEINKLVYLAHNIEARVLQTPTGTQDYFPAAEPGLHIIDYSVEGPESEILKPDATYLQERMVLVYTGVPHHSGINNWQVIKESIARNQNTLSALEEVADIADQVAQVCRQGQWNELAPLFEREFQARVRLSAGFSSPEIEQLRGHVLQAGAKAVKICGAGGGGCVMIWTEPDRRSEVLQACQKNNFQVLDAKPVVRPQE